MGGGGEVGGERAVGGEGGVGGERVRSRGMGRGEEER